MKPKKCTLVLVLIISTSLFLNINLSSKNLYNPDNKTINKIPSHETYIKKDLTPHVPIYITSDENFTHYGFPGNGTEDNPFIIENYFFSNTTETGNSITIRDTTKHFIIRNCLLNTSYSAFNGILLSEISPSTATIVNNTICENNHSGLYIELCDDVEISENLILDNLDYGICMKSSESVLLENNIVKGNKIHGIYLYNNRYAEIYNNIVGSNDQFGLFLSHSQLSTVFNNNITANNLAGLHLEQSSFNQITNNSIADNSEQGIYLYSFSCSNQILFNSINNNTLDGIYLYDNCDDTIVKYNIISNNSLYGITITATSPKFQYNNIILYNSLINNNPNGTSQAFDDGYTIPEDTNFWSYNFWSNHLEPDDNLDGIVDLFYAIDGGDTLDLNPLTASPQSLNLKPLIVNFYGISSNSYAGINAIVFDNQEIAHVLVFYRINNGPWQNTSIDSSSFEYTYYFGPFTKTTSINCYIVAFDNEGNSAESIVITAQAYVEPSTEPEPTTPLTSTTVGDSYGLLLIIPFYTLALLFLGTIKKRRLLKEYRLK